MKINSQQLLLDLVKMRVEQQPTLKRKIIELLEISDTTWHRIINGNSNFDLNQSALLIRELQLDPVALFYPERHSLSCEFPALGIKEINPESFLRPMNLQMEALHQLKDVTIFYTTRELPMFYYLSDEVLASFKFRIFEDSPWNKDGHKPVPFSPSEGLKPESLSNLARMAWYQYCKLPSVEFWTENTIDNTLKQIITYTEAGLFLKKEDAFILLESISKLINYVMDMSIAGEKIHNGNKTGARFKMYINDNLHTNNAIFVETPRFRQLFYTFDNPNYLIFKDEKLMDYFKEHILRLKSMSKLMNESTVADQISFTKKIETKIEFCRTKVDAIARELY